MADIWYGFVLVIGIFWVSYLLNKKNRGNKGVTVCSGVLISVMIYYFIIPLICIIFKSELENYNGYMKVICNYDWDNFLIGICAVVLFVGTFYLSYSKKNTKKKTYIYQFSPNKMFRVTRFFFWCSFLVGSISFLLYIRAFGGVARLLSYAEYLRSFATSGEMLVSYYSSLLVIPSKLIMVAPILAVYLIQNRESILYKICLVMAIILAVLYLLSNSGKAPIILFTLSFVVPYMKKYMKHPWRWMIIIGCLSLPILGVLDGLFMYLAGGEWKVTSREWIDFIPQFVHPWANTLSLREIIDIDGFRWGKDFVTGVLNILPGINFAPSFEVTSMFYSGSNWRNIGGTPTDIILFGYFQFGYLGVLLVGWICGILVGKIDRILRQIPNDYACSVIKTSMIVNMFTLITNADPTSIIMGQFQLIIASLCVLYSKKTGKVEVI